MKRFERVEIFLNYLAFEEDGEFESLSLAETGGLLGERIIPSLQTEFERERAWIERRLRENRERYSDDLNVTLGDAAAFEELFGSESEEEDPAEDSPS